MSSSNFMNVIRRHLRLDTTRAQVFISCLGLVFIVIVISFFITYSALSVKLNELTTRYVSESASLASYNLDAQLEQVDSTFQQLVLEDELQRILSTLNAEGDISLEERLLFRNLVLKNLIYSRYIDSVEIYSKQGELLFPLNEQELLQIVTPDQIIESRKDPGKTVWINPSEVNDDLMALRNIRILNDWSDGGFILFHINSDVFQNIGWNRGANDFIYLVYDADSKILHHPENKEPVDLQQIQEQSLVEWDGQSYYPFMYTSEASNWRLVALTPNETLKESVHLLQYILFWVGIVGIVFAILISLGLSLLITRPLYDIRKKMNFSRNGEFQDNPVLYFNREVNELNVTYNRMSQRIAHLIQEVYEKERLGNQSAIKALQAQINPHFLFNTLEALNWMLRNKNDHESAQMIVTLSELFRYTTGRTVQSDTALLSAELEQVDRYFKMMQLRLQERLQYEIEVDAVIGSFMVPRLILQPLVENAITHGIENVLHTGIIKVRVYVEDHHLKISVVDNGNGIPAARLDELQTYLKQGDQRANPYGFGIGLFNVHQRVQLNYGMSYGLEIQSEWGKGTNVTLVFPYYISGGR